MNSRWVTDDPKKFVEGDIICDRKQQRTLSLVVKVTDEAIWTTGLVLCSLTENNEEHPLFPLYFEEMEKGYVDPMIRLGNLKDYMQFITDVQGEIEEAISTIKRNERQNDNEKGE